MNHPAKPWIVRWESEKGAHCGRRFTKRKAAFAFEERLWARRLDGSTFYIPQSNRTTNH